MSIIIRNTETSAIALKAPVIKIPPSKSHTIRALLLASFAKGISIIDNILLSDDTKAVIKILKDIGVDIHCIHNFYNNTSSVKIIPPEEGLKVKLSNAPENIFVNVENSGSMFYFFSIILSTIPCVFTISGDESVRKRPITPITQIYDALKIKYIFLDKNLEPIKERDDNFYAIKVVGGNLKNENNIFVDGKFSQPITGLLFAAAISGQNLQLRLSNPGEIPYLKMSIEWLKFCGIEVNNSEDFSFIQIVNPKNIMPFKKSIPADWSSAAFPIAAAVATNSKCRLLNLDINDVQGDSAIIDILKKMNVTIVCKSKRNEIVIFPSKEKLIGGNIDCADIPDAVPAISAIAYFAKTQTSLDNINICRFKECNRIEVIAEQLTKLKSKIIQTENTLLINPPSEKTKTPVQITMECYKDHRIAMMLTVIGMGLAKENRGTVYANNSIADSFHFKILNGEYFKITYPNFLNDMKMFGVEIFEI